MVTVQLGQPQPEFANWSLMSIERGHHGYT